MDSPGETERDLLTAKIYTHARAEIEGRAAWEENITEVHQGSRRSLWQLLGGVMEMNRDDASKQTEADRWMMMDDGWKKQEMLRPVQAQASPSTGLMQARQCFSYTKAMKLKWINISKIHRPVVKKQSCICECEKVCKCQAMNTAATKTQMHKYQSWWCWPHNIRVSKAEPSSDTLKWFN